MISLNFKYNLLKILFGVVIGLFLAFLFRCEPKCPECPEVGIITNETTTSDTTTKRNVEIKEVPGPERIVEVPVPYYIQPDSTDSVYSFRIDQPDLKADISVRSKSKVSDFLAKYNVTAKETTITDTVTVTNTITKEVIKTIEAKRRMNLLIGSNLMFSPNSLNGVNFNVSLKTRKDLMIEVGYNAYFNGSDSYEAGVKIPIFHRNKK